MEKGRSLFLYSKSKLERRRHVLKPPSFLAFEATKKAYQLALAFFGDVRTSLPFQVAAVGLFFFAVQIKSPGRWSSDWFDPRVGNHQ